MCVYMQIPIWIIFIYLLSFIWINYERICFSSLLLSFLGTKIQEEDSLLKQVKKFKERKVKEKLTLA